jgi:tetratricopeptide (TPR) repeat protein
MSLLIDALKRAERAKNGQPEPALATQSTTERAVESASGAQDWTVDGIGAEPMIGDAVLESHDVSARAEPQFANPIAGIALREPAYVPPMPASKIFASAKAAEAKSATEREAAQTLFDAKRPTSRSRAGMFALFGIAALLLAGGGFYVWYSLAFPPTPAFSPLPSRVATTAPVPVSPVSAQPVVPPAASVVEAAGMMSPTPPEPTAAISSVPTPRAEDARQKPKKSRRNFAETTPPADEQSSDEVVQREIEQARRAQSTRRSKNVGNAVNVGKGQQTGFDADIALAYNSLLSGDRAEAKRLYTIAAERDPFNTDALLGLATIAGNQGDLNGAERYYRRALEVDPQNASALAGLASLRQLGGPSESQLKFELARSPDSAPLRFALGNQMANEGRWDEAQQAYFDAVSLDTRNADYAYNLAVSLDQLNQAKQAAIYYRKALELSKVHGAKFRAADISARLAELGLAQ